MKLIPFCFLTALSVIYAVLTMAETLTYHRWEGAMNDQKYIQAEVTYFDHLNSILDEMIKRMAYLSHTDPAIAQLLKDHNINVIFENKTPDAAPTPNGFDVAPPANPNPPASNKPEQAPATSTPSHP